MKLRARKSKGSVVFNRARGNLEPPLVRRQKTKVQNAGHVVRITDAC
jgi:hypothetical protein